MLNYFFAMRSGNDSKEKCLNKMTHAFLKGEAFC